MRPRIIPTSPPTVLQRRQALKDAIASTTEALQSATTASEVQKLTGVLIGQNAALAATDKEIDQAVAVSVEQDIENRNDAQKQAAAEQEEQKAEMVETFDNYRTNFQLNTQPPMFPDWQPMKLKILLLIAGIAMVGGSITVLVVQSNARKLKFQPPPESQLPTAISNYNKTFKLNTSPADLGATHQWKPNPLNCAKRPSRITAIESCRGKTAF